ncbi:error-prone DNA polymerase [Arthrobacter sp. Hiyo4]|nr:error-prone DNA polymerase [Arthrobacter sp. Hiyo4]
MYPKRLLVAEARRLGIPILALDINRSQAEYRVERVTDGPDAGKLGIRLSLNGIYGLSGTELKRIVAGQPYDSLADLRARSRLSKPSIKRLAQLGAFDSLHRESGGAANRADLVQHLQQLQAAGGTRKGLDIMDGQLSLPLGTWSCGTSSPGFPRPPWWKTSGQNWT